jgi:hypothetical protein
MAAALDGGHLALALEAATRQRNSLAYVEAMYKRLHANVVPADGLGLYVGSASELILRARQLVISTQLERLRALEGELGAAERMRGWFVGEFGGFEDVDRFLRAAFRNSNDLWMRFREDHVDPERRQQTARRELYRAGVRAAQCALREVRHHADLAHLLRSGLAASDWPAVLTACTEVVVAISVCIEIEGGSPIAPAPRAQTPEATPVGEAHARRTDHVGYGAVEVHRNEMAALAGFAGGVARTALPRRGDHGEPSERDVLTDDERPRKP